MKLNKVERHVLAKLLKQKMKEKRMNLTQFADYTGIWVETLSDICSEARRPQRKTLEGIAYGLDMTDAELIDTLRKKARQELLHMEEESMDTLIPLNEKNVQFVKEQEGKRLYVLLGEECSELIQAASKMFRILDGDPTPVTVEQTQANLEEELSDIILVADLIGIKPNAEICARKLVRWTKRLKGETNE